MLARAGDAAGETMRAWLTPVTVVLALAASPCGGQEGPAARPTERTAATAPEPGRQAKGPRPPKVIRRDNPGPLLVVGACLLVVALVPPALSTAALVAAYRSGRRPVVWWLAVPGVVGSALGVAAGVHLEFGFGSGLLPGLGLLLGAVALVKARPTDGAQDRLARNE